MLIGTQYIRMKFLTITTEGQSCEVSKFLYTTETKLMLIQTNLLYN